MIAGSETPDAGEITVGPDREARRRRTEPRVARRRRRPSSTTSAAVSTRSRSGSSKCRPAPTSGASISRARDQQKIVGTLSGGERGRLHLAKTLLSGANVLLLDEPSNDLDVETLRALEDALGEFAGTRAGRQPRPLVPRPHRDPHPRVRRRFAACISSKATTRSTKPTSARVSAKKPPRPHRIRYRPLTVK